ncbi:MAG: hypothetical protein WAV07_15700 [Candidatus Contendobacter sp.]
MRYASGGTRTWCVRLSVGTALMVNNNNSLAGDAELGDDGFHSEGMPWRG